MSLIILFHVVSFVEFYTFQCLCTSVAVASDQQDTESKTAVASNAEHKDDTKIQDANGDENVDEDQKEDDELSSDENPAESADSSENEDDPSEISDENQDDSKMSDVNADEGKVQGLFNIEFRTQII